jgi:hypothetical protein
MAEEVRRAADGDFSHTDLVALARIDFGTYVELMFPVLHQGAGLIHAPYVDLIVDALVRSRKGGDRRIIINLPPGFMKSLLVSILDKLVLDGEIRIEAAKLLGLAAVPCLRINHLTDVEQRTLRLAVNRLSEKGRWDLGELRIEFEELILTDAPIEFSGFSLDEIDQIVLGDEPEAAEQGPLAPEPEAIAVARPGDVFRLGAHRVFVAMPPIR